MIEIDLTTDDKMAAFGAMLAKHAATGKPVSLEAVAKASGTAKPETYAATLMRLYPERVLRFLETFSDEQLANTAGLATDEEMNANYMNLMLRETTDHGSN
jgi:hypothetical protein